MKKPVEIDWTQYGDVEAIPGKQSGAPLIKGTRIPAQQIFEESELGSPVDEISENYPSLTRDRIRRLLAYASKHKSQPVQ